MEDHRAQMEAEQRARSLEVNDVGRSGRELREREGAASHEQRLPQKIALE